MSITTRRQICIGIFIAAFINFAVFWLIAVYLGGDAINGRIADGHYYLMAHGRYTEVSAAVFNYSEWHVYSVWITHPLAFLAALAYFRLNKLERKVR